MVILVLVVATATSAVLVGFAVHSWPSSDPAAEMSESVSRKLRRAGFLRARLDPSTATGLALTAASACVVLGGVVAGVLFYLVRAHSGTLDVDAAVADWAAAHASGPSTSLMRAVTILGSTPVIVGVTFVVGFIEFRRIRSRSLWLFLALTVGGELLVVNLIKAGVARARPAIDPLAGFSGSSFPSGHTAASAACYAALALVVSRGRTPRARSVLAGIAAGIAVAVGMSRMLLGVHWFTDVVAGLAIGWAWFALCAIATGGRLLRFGRPAQIDTNIPTRQPTRSTLTPQHP
jgi:membrane-associated phospholipid phosphatase